jgi:hypothetical protein
MTQMPVTLRDASQTMLAEGALSFSLQTLPRFLASWVSPSRAQQHDLDVRRRAIARAMLGAGV